MIGTTISHYKVLEKIGEGGMGVVYRATDTKLNRDVALKILPERFASDSQRMGRFQREAEVLASLDHPNIGQIYGIEEAGQTKALVLQLIEGPTLAERIAQGPIPVEETLKIALQIAEGLEAAHEKGVIHRDLKPANIKITPEGQVKILDFGLAKALEGETPPDSSLSQSPTLTAAATQAGVILGTAAYMSPEQARGKPTDRRADIWAIGIVLFEMLSGKRAFEGEDVSQTLAAVIMTEPDWSLLPSETPRPILQLLKRCLDRDPHDRLQAIGEFRIAVSRYLANPVDPLAQPVTDAVQAHQRRMLPWLAAIALTAIVAVIATWTLKPTEPQPVAARFYHELPDGQVFTRPRRPLVAISPDGSQIVYAANQQLYLRNLDEMEAHPIQGTDEDPGSPFFSPDGKWVGYHSRSDSQLRKIAPIGGAPVTLCDVPEGTVGASWDSDDTIMYGQPEGIMRVSANGGTPELVVPTEEGEQVHGPQMLPGGEWVLFTLTTASGLFRWDEAQIVVQSLDSGERKILWEGGSDARYVPTGHLLYALENVLFALPFDLANLEVSGGPVPIVEGVRRAQPPVTASANYGFSAQGTLVYVPGSVNDAPRTLVWVDREGNEETIPAEPRGYEYLRISHDGRRVAVDEANRSGDIWVWNLAGGNSFRLTSAEESEMYPIWTADDSRIAFGVNPEKLPSSERIVSWKASNNTGVVEPLIPDLSRGRQGMTPYFFTSEDKQIVFREQEHPDTGDNIGLVSLDADSDPVWLVASEFNERNAELSPNGLWMAYQLDESGQYEIYVRPFPNVEDNLWIISTAGGLKPLWARDGRTLFYLEPGTPARLMAVPVQTDPTFQHQSPQKVLEWPYDWGNEGRSYDVSMDGQRFLTVKPGEADEDASPPQINIVLNWFEELKERVPVP